MRAYELSQSPDCGSPEENWLRAERELLVVHEYDTFERDLEHAGMKVSRFPLEAGVLWRLDLPRGEQLEAWEPGNNGLAPPDEIRRLIETVAAGKALLPTAPLSDDPGAMRLREMLEAQRRSLLRHDPGTRLGADPENLHQHRVAARRIRAFLRSTRRFTEVGWRNSLSALLRELGESTGPVRDFDVLLEHLEGAVGGLDTAEQPAGRVLIDRLRVERESVRRGLLVALDSDAYRLLLTRLRPPPRLASEVTAIPLRELAKKEFRRLLETVDELGKHPDDTMLHRLRIGLKRARYAAELAAPAGKAGSSFLADAKALQTLLGEHQDAVVTEKRLREVSAGLDASAAFVAGRLAERQRVRRAQVREQLPAAWKRLRRSGRRLH